MSIDPKVLKQVRVALGLSQQQLADALKLSRVTVNKMERGRLARGIPDEIGDKLMALRGPIPDRNKPPPAKPRGIIDNHLWDNEEDDQ